MPRPYRPIPKEIILEAIKKFREGKTQKQIRDELKLDEKKLRKGLLENGITQDEINKRAREARSKNRIENGKVSPEAQKAIVGLFNEGKSQKEIADSQNISTSKVRATLLENGITEEQLEARHKEIIRRNSSRNAKLKPGSRNEHIEIIRIFREEIVKKNGDSETVTKAEIKCDCGVQKTIYLANFRRTKSCSTTCWHALHDHSRKVDLLNRWFGFLWCIKEGPKEGGKDETSKNERRTYYVYCQSCNTYPEKPIRASSLTSGNTNRCNNCRTLKSANTQKIELKGQQYGALAVLREWGNKKSKKRNAVERMWLCRCDGCGSTDPYQQNNLRSGNSRQCSKCGGQFKDNLQTFLADREYASRPCFYYIANIENGKYIKPGIGEDLEERERTSKGKYTNYHHTSNILKRAEAWTIEQLVLDACYSARPKRLDSSYAEWAGTSELRDPRKISLSELKEYTKIAKQETLKVGWEYIWVSRWKLPKTPESQRVGRS